MQVDLKTSPELSARIKELLPALEAQHVSSLSVFSYHRPGEPEFWLAYLYVDGSRHVAGTPDLRHLPLADQAEDLLRQLAGFAPK